MPAYCLHVAFSGLDPEDNATLDAIETIPYISWVFQNDCAKAVAHVTASSALEAARWVLAEVRDRAPLVTPERLDRDLVAIPDIASRLGLTREAVRHWATGARRATTGFPSPLGVVGDGIKVWDWASVDGWLDQNLGLGDGFSRPDGEDAARIDLLIRQHARSEAVASPANRWSMQVRSMTVSPPRELPNYSRNEPALVKRVSQSSEFCLAG